MPEKEPLWPQSHHGWPVHRPLFHRWTRWFRVDMGDGSPGQPEERQLRAGLHSPAGQGAAPAEQNTSVSMGQSRVLSQEANPLATQPLGKLPNQPPRFHSERPGRGRGGLDTAPPLPTWRGLQRAGPCGLLPRSGPLCPGCQALSLPGTCPESSACGDWPSRPGSQALSN